eukprot:TRINITY_DN2824_c0_g1_i3.p1 TRINITY_DN2824_c0_g1~~TRINITY_DN2824_c0_g1_i3.p1  ORF type:complete len:1258 (+),score=190.58 TRINITY_DN2824_c0_g1_i3:83-3775(+)
MKGNRGPDTSSEVRLSKELSLYSPFEPPSTWALSEEEEEQKTTDWRLGKDRTKTNHVLLLLCLNVGIDPPDVLRVEPCAKIECWTDPLIAQSKMLTKGSEVIGDLLIQQYKSLQKTATYKACLELSDDDMKYQLQAMRKKAKDGRVLVHYNGHGVPRVTQFGELWFFDPDHTQYVPVTITEIMGRIGTPTIYVLDCSNAGAILHYWYKHNFHQTRQKDILICACRRHEDLPLNPILPADLLTSCLTTPIRASLEWYFHYSQRECLLPNITKEMIAAVPGNAADRKTPLGELTWIFTAVTDAIAWCALPRNLFNRLFRPRFDMLQVALFRGFLLADRVMRETGCVPVSHPPLPETHSHPLWEAWELALEGILSQLPSMLNADLTPNPSYTYRPSSFFSEQLTAFEIWVEFGSSSQPAPDQLPCIIQGLSSHQYRVRSLRLLARYLDLGSWAVIDALSCGVMPYVCRLLQQSDLVFIMVVIWSKILLVDKTEATFSDLIKVQVPPAKVFLEVLSPPSSGNGQDDKSAPQEIPSTHYSMEGTTILQCKAMACFILSSLLDGCGLDAQITLWNSGLLHPCLAAMGQQPVEEGGEAVPLLKAWAAMCFSKLIKNIPVAIDHCIDEVKCHVHDLAPLLQDHNQQVRAAACVALSQLIGRGASLLFKQPEPRRFERRRDSASAEALPPPPTGKVLIFTDLAILQYLSDVVSDPSPLVRQEVLHALVKYYVAYKIAPNSKETADAMGLLHQVDTKSLLDEENPTTNYSHVSGGTKALPILTEVVPEFGSEDLDGESVPESQSPDIAEYYDLRLKLMHDVTSVLKSLTNDPYPYLEAKVNQVIDTLNAQYGKSTPQSPARSPHPLERQKSNGPRLPKSSLYVWMQTEFQKPLFSVEEAVPALERRKFREQINRDTIQGNISKCNEKNYLPSPSGPAEKITKAQISITPVVSGNQAIVDSKFRAFMPQAVIADSNNTISLVDLTTRSVLNSVRHRAPICQSFVLNDATDTPSILVTDQNGCVSVYSNICPAGPAATKPSLVTSFMATRNPTRVCADWQPADRALIYAGDSSKIQLFSLEDDRLQQSISLPSRGVDVSVVKADEQGTRTLAAGFVDGSVRYWDARVGSARLSARFAHPGSTDPVVALFLRSGSYQIYSVHQSSITRIWDIRANRNDSRKLDAYRGKSITFAHLHHTHPLLLCGRTGSDQTGKLEFINTKNELLGDINLPKVCLTKREYQRE